MNSKIFEQTALPYMTLLRTYAYHLTMNSENAKDLVQDTYLKAYRFWSQFEHGSNVKAWLYCIMKNSYINHYRKGKKEPQKVEYQDYHLPCNGNQETSSGHTYLPEKDCSELFDDEVARSIGSLHESFREILVLSDIEGLTYEEIAEVIHCPIGTVRSRLHRSRKLMREKLFMYAKENRYIHQEPETNGVRQDLVSEES